MKYTFILSLLCLHFFAAFAQNYCQPQRFSQTNFFPPGQIVSDLDRVYGVAPDSSGTLDSLRYDLYMPSPVHDQVTERPFILFVHGGAWQGGSKSALASTALYFAGKGYVCASIDYRVGWDWGDQSCEEADSLSYAKARLRAIQDGKSALRYFAHFADSLRINPDYFFVYGSSAGAGMLAEVIYLDSDEYETLAGPDLLAELGGAEGIGNPYTDAYRVVGSHMDAPSMTDTSYINASDTIPGIFFHGTADSTVIYISGPRGSCPNEEIGYMYGSRTITQRLGNLGVCYELNFEVGAPHGALYTTDYLRTHTTCFFKNVLCDDCMVNEFDSAAAPCTPLQIGWDIQPVPKRASLAPNPATNSVEVSVAGLRKASTATLYDLSGRALRQVNLQPGQATEMSVTGLRPGLYLLRLADGSVTRLRIVRE